jgi:hypothetical protein
MSPQANGAAVADDINETFRCHFLSHVKKSTSYVILSIATTHHF